jgi:hypothetical protein
VFAYHVADTTMVSLYTSDRLVDEIGVGDFNADGAMDAVVASSGEPNIDILYRDAGDGMRPITFRRVRVGTTSSPHTFVIGDFDGDHTDDFLFFEAPAPKQDRMQIAYGSPGGAAAPVEIAEFQDVVASVPIQLIDSNDPDKRVTDVAVAELRDGALAPVIDILHGATERAMIPYIDPLSATGDQLMFTTVAAGHFLPNNPFVTEGFVPLDIASVAVDPSGSTAPVLWVLQGAGVGTIEAVTDQPTSSHAISMSGWQFCGTPPPTNSPIQFCLDNAAVVPWPSGTHDLFLALDALTGTFAAVDPTAASASVIPSTGKLGVNPQLKHAKLLAAPLDGEMKLVVVSEVGAWACDVASNGAVGACPVLADQPGAKCTDAALGRIGAGAATGELFMLCDGARISRFDTSTGGTLVFPLPLEALLATQPMTSLAIGDVTGDAVDDIVVGNGSVAIVFRQKTSTEAPAP